MIDAEEKLEDNFRKLHILHEKLENNYSNLETKSSLEIQMYKTEYEYIINIYRNLIQMSGRILFIYSIDKGTLIYLGDKYYKVFKKNNVILNCKNFSWLSGIDAENKNIAKDYFKHIIDEKVNSFSFSYIILNKQSNEKELVNVYTLLDKDNNIYGMFELEGIK